jgi:phage tail-like protein
MPPRTSAFDPYRTWKFRVRIGNSTVAGVTKVSALGRSVAANEVKQAGDLLGPRQNPGQVTYDDITLEQGWSADRTLEEWANAAIRLHDDPGVSNFKRTVYLDVYDLHVNAGGAALTSYKLHRCWVSKYVAMPELSADSGGVGIRSVTLKHEGWERTA